MEHPAEARDRSLLGKCTRDGTNTAPMYSEDLARVARGSLEPERPRQRNLGCLEPYRESTTRLLDLGQVSAHHGSPRLASSISYVSRRLGTCLQGHCLDAERAHQPDLSRLCRGWKTRSSLPSRRREYCPATGWSHHGSSPSTACVRRAAPPFYRVPGEAAACAVRRGRARAESALLPSGALAGDQRPGARGGGHAATAQVPAASRETLKLSTL